MCVRASSLDFNRIICDILSKIQESSRSETLGRPILLFLLFRKPRPSAHAKDVSLYSLGVGRDEGMSQTDAGVGGRAHVHVLSFILTKHTSERPGNH